MLSRQRHCCVGGLGGSRTAAGSLLSGPLACCSQGSRRGVISAAAARDSTEPPHHTQRPRRPQLKRRRFPNAVAKPQQQQQPLQQQATSAERPSPQQLPEAPAQHQAAQPAAAAGPARSSSSSSNSSPVALLTASAEASAGISAGLRRTPGNHLADLSEEQLEAVLCDAQHIRVIAGPGSGKTRAVTARVAELIARGVPPEALLVITFTRKAAGELLERVSQLLGPALARRLKPRTFHSVCVELLRKYNGKLPPQQQKFHVADQDDADELVNRAVVQVLGSSSSSSSSSSSQASLLDAAIKATPAAQLVRSSRRRGSTASGGSAASSSTSSSNTTSTSTISTASSSSSSRSSKEDKKTFKDMRQLIGLLKNFAPTLHRSGPQQERLSGMELVQQLVRDGVPEFTRLAGRGDNRQLLRLAAVYDRYMAELAHQRMLDFDDLLHACLALIKSDPQVAAELHSGWTHVLVDEGQDTNHAQFGLVRQFTGASSSLFMVGDPCQAIYGFRGALSRLLCDDFERVYQRHGPATLFLSDNYRSRPPIVQAADLVKKYGGSAKLLQDATCMRGSGASGSKVLLQECSSLSAERKLCTSQLKHWQRSGYGWGEMAVLCRTNWMAEQLYQQAVEQGIPARLVTGLQLWERPEVKSALALLRCVVHPVSAGDVIRRRLAGSTTIKLSSLDGLGGEALAKLQSHLAASQPAAGAASSNASSSGRTTLGSCLLAHCCPSDMPAEQAGKVMASWAEDTAAAEAAGPAGSAEHQAALMAGLQRLAPVWQPPPGYRSIRSAKQKAAVAQLRGLVLLGRAAAHNQQPAEVLQLLLKVSGIWGTLEAAAASSGDAGLTDDDDGSSSAKSVKGSKPGTDPAQEKRTARKRLGSLRALLILAQRISAANSNSSSSSSDDEDAADAALQQQEPQLEEAQQQVGLGALQRFYDYCVLQGEDDKEDAEPKEVQFMSMHASKGKEFPCVVLPHSYDGMLPLLRADDAASSPSGDELEQEKNLLFVGMTRAKDHLLITWPNEQHYKDKRGEWHSEPVQVSRFLTQAVVAAKNRALAGVEYRCSAYN